MHTLLSHGVTTLDNKLLLSAGSVLSTETIEAVIHSGISESYQEHPLLEYGSIKQDLFHFLNSPVYQSIFSDEKETADILNVMANVHVISPVLKSLDYFKEQDVYTYCHILRVFALCTLLAKDLVSDYDDWIKGAESGPVHDIGKICMPTNVLKKSDPLTPAELSMLRHHSVAGYVLLSYYFHDYRSFSVIVTRDHHERRDGSGYPCGTQLTDDLVEIIAVCDIYDALISPRPYRPVEYENRTALEELTKMSEEGVFAWKPVKALVAHVRKNKPHYSDCFISKEKRGTPPLYNNYGVVEDDDPQEGAENNSK